MGLFYFVIICRILSFGQVEVKKVAGTTLCCPAVLCFIRD
jgi:hypothetical protein